MSRPSDDEKTETIRAENDGGYDLLIETGIYDGNCRALHLADTFAERIVIDVNLGNCERALEADPLLNVWHGDSALILGTLLLSIERPALFWLDAHPMTVQEPSPLLAELAAISAWQHGARSTVLIDDMRLMGEGAWPTIGEVCGACVSTWDVRVYNDIMRCTPKP